jgi:hypothetical protein
MNRAPTGVMVRLPVCRSMFVLIWPEAWLPLCG